MEYIAFIIEEDGRFNAVVPDLAGCVSYGETYEQAYEMIQEAAELWIEDQPYYPKAEGIANYTENQLDQIIKFKIHMIEV